MGRIIRYVCIGVLLIGAVICSAFLPRRDLRSTGQVAGFALDYKQGKIIATFELYQPVADQPIGSACEIVVAEGESVEECISNAARTVGKELYLEDTAVLILGEQNNALLLEKAMDYYRIFKNEQMDLPVFFAKKQQAGMIFDRKAKILSTQIAKSSALLKKRITMRDWLNGEGEVLWIRGEGSYEIIS